MNIELIIEAMARVDGFEDQYIRRHPITTGVYPAYTTSHDAVIRVFARLPTTQQCVIIKALIGEDFSSVENISDPIKWCELIIKHGDCCE